MNSPEPDPTESAVPGPLAHPGELVELVGADSDADPMTRFTAGNLVGPALTAGLAWAAVARSHDGTQCAG